MRKFLPDLASSSTEVETPGLQNVATSDGHRRYCNLPKDSVVNISAAFSASRLQNHILQPSMVSLMAWQSVFHCVTDL